MKLFRVLFRLFFGHRSRTQKWRTPPIIFDNPPPFVPPHSRPQHSKPRPQPQLGTVLSGRCWVVDGDTIVIDKVHIRLAGIDAPELDHPYGKQSKWALVQLCKGEVVTARIKSELSYDRVVAECYLSDGRDLAAEMVRSGMALDWPKFSGGKYQHLETVDARRKLWRASARQRGKLRPQNNSNS